MKQQQQRKKLFLLATSLSLALSPLVTNAANEIKWNGYLNAIGAISDSPTKYLEDINDNGDFSHTSFGLAASKRLNAKASVAGQLHGSSEGFIFDWGYAQYRFNDNLTGKAGRIKYAGNLVSETIDVGVTYPWVRPPESIYLEAIELAFEAYNGGSLLFVSGDDTEFGAELYAGEITGDDDSHKKMLGLVLSATNDNIRAQIGLNTSTLETVDVTDPQSEKTKTFLSAGIRAEYEIASIYAEYTQSEVSDISVEDKSGWYVTLLRQFNDWTPHFTYQSFETISGGPEQTSFTLGINNQLDYSTVVKIELQQVDPTNGGLFEVQPADGKVNIFNLSLNLIF